MLAWRLLVSTILIPVLIGIFWLDANSGARAPWLLGLSLLLAARAAWELCQLLRVRSVFPHTPIAIVCTLAVVAAAWIVHWQRDSTHADPTLAALGFVGFTYAMCVLAALLKGAIAYREPGTTIEALGAELLVISYVGVLLATTAQLRWVAGAGAGYLVLGSLVVAAKCGDIGAYTAGRLFGKRKMAPRLSPGKTWAGFVGALIGAGLGAMLWFAVAPRTIDDSWPIVPWYWGALYGVILGLVGLIGDLCESLIKRDVGQKDAASLFPGFGGLLDLLDSILYAGPVALLLWKLLPLAG